MSNIYKDLPYSEYRVDYFDEDDNIVMREYIRDNILRDKCDIVNPFIYCWVPILGFIVKDCSVYKTLQTSIVDDKTTINVFTPYHIAKEMVLKANIKEDDFICEPSAGTGSIVNAILKNSTVNKYRLITFETDPVGRVILEREFGIRTQHKDVKAIDLFSKIDKIICNPPTENGLLLEHIKLLYNHLDKNGILVLLTMASCYDEIKDFLKDTSYTVSFNEPFKVKDITIKSIIVTISK